jgi:hypothetical protein
MSIRQIFFSISLLAIALTGCTEPTQPDKYSRKLVISAFLIAEQPIDSVFITRTAGISEYYDPALLAITDAVVQITLVDTVNSSANVTYTLLHDAANPGRYYSSATILPLRTYLLSVNAPGYPLVSGRTSVPDTFSIVNRDEIPDTVLFDPNSAAYTLRWNSGRNNFGYVISVTSVDTDANYIPDDWHGSGDEKPDRSSSGFIMPNNNSIAIPWLAISYYGRNDIVIEAVDSNYFEFLRQYVVSQGPEIRQIRYNLTNGAGVFGSSARAYNCFSIYVKPS